MNATTITPTCWCGTPAEFLVPIDPAATPWDGELVLAPGEPAAYACQDHLRDGYARLEQPAPAFQLGRWTLAQLHNVRATAIATDDNEELVLAIDAELEKRVNRGDLDWPELRLDRAMAEAALRDQTATVIADLILEARDLSKARLEALGMGLPSELWQAVAHKIEACPVHFCDVAICEDDEDEECPAGREAAAR